MLATAPVSISSTLPTRIVTPLYPHGVVASTPGLSTVVADPHGNRAGLAARAGQVAYQNYKAVEAMYGEFVIHAYDPRTGNVWLQHQSGSAVHCVNRVTGKCDCADAVKGRTKQLRMACTEAGLNPDELPEAAWVNGVTGLFCKHFQAFGLIRVALKNNASDAAAEVALCQMPTDLPRKFWALCPSKQTIREVR